MKIFLGGLSLFLVGCTDALESTDERKAEAEEDFSYEQSYLTAFERLEMAKLSAEAEWSPDAEIVDRFPVYLPGGNEPSYYEYKVEDQGMDAGYILVNIDELDIPIPEMATAGTTLNEMFNEYLDYTDIRVFRHNWVTSVAFSQPDNQMVAAVGGTPDGGFAYLDEIPDDDGTKILLLKAHEALSKTFSIGETPWAKRDVLKKIHSQKEELSLITIQRNIDLHLKNMEIDRVGPYKLRNVFPGTNIWRTPQWDQSVRNGKAVGCGAVAWTLLYAYWHQYKNRRGLFQFKDLEKYARDGQEDGTFIEDIMWDLANNYLETFWWDGQGATLPSKMYLGKYYARDVGYGTPGFHKEDIGAWDMWNLARDEIKGDRPAILYLDSRPGNMEPDLHYAVVEGVQKFTGIFDSLGYYVNMGWGKTGLTSDHLWIYDVSGDPEYPIFDGMYVNNIPYVPLEALYMNASNFALQ